MTAPPDSTNSTPDWLETAFLAAYFSQVEPPALAELISRFPSFEREVAGLYARTRQRSVAHDPSTEDTELVRIGRYEPVRSLGRGSQGSVYLARDRELDRDVVLKVLHSASHHPDRFSGLRWSRELRLAARIEHPGVCPLLDYGRDAGRSFAVFPWVQGCSLRELLGPSSAAEDPADHARLRDRIGVAAFAEPAVAPRREGVLAAIGFVRKLAIAVQAIHEQGVVHRDLKPANVMVRHDGDPVVLDLGLAHDQSESLELTEDGSTVGTPAYMAPEQIRADTDRIGPATDLWALGVILHELLTGERPFHAPTREALYHAILSGPRIRLGSGVGPLASPLRSVLVTLLATEPGQRYASAADLAEDLRRVDCSEPILARPPSLPTRVRLWIRRRPALAASLVGTISALLALIVALVLLLREQSESRTHLADKHAALRQLATEMILDVQIQLSKVPGTLALRRRMFDKALTYLKTLEQDSDRDARLYHDLFEARLGLGDLLGHPSQDNLGDSDAALSYYRSALALTEEIAQRHPPGITATHVHRYRARVHEKLGSLMLLALNQFVECRPHFEQALREIRIVLASDEVVVEDEALQIAVLVRQANALSMSREFEAALSKSQQACTASAALLGSHPESKDLLTNHAGCLLGHWAALANSSRVDDGLSVLMAFEPRLITEARARPDHAALSHYRIAFAAEIGRGLVSLGRFQDGLERLATAAALQAQRETRDPDNEMVVRLGLRLGMERVRALAQAGRTADALPLARETAERAARLSERFPASKLMRARAAEICGRVAALHRSANDTERAETFARLARSLR